MFLCTHFLLCTYSCVHAFYILPSGVHIPLYILPIVYIFFCTYFLHTSYWSTYSPVHTSYCVHILLYIFLYTSYCVHIPLYILPTYFILCTHSSVHTSYCVHILLYIFPTYFILCTHSSVHTSNCVHILLYIFPTHFRHTSYCVHIPLYIFPTHFLHTSYCVHIPLYILPTVYICLQFIYTSLNKVNKENEHTYYTLHKLTPPQSTTPLNLTSSLSLPPYSVYHKYNRACLRQTELIKVEPGFLKFLKSRE